MPSPVRTLVVWCRDWPVVALGQPTGQTVAVFAGNRVVATSAAARVAGIRVGLRRREAQRLCPQVVVAQQDLDREARAFERIAAALEAVTPRIEITRPGACTFPVRGPARYFGGDMAVAGRVMELVGELLGGGDGCGVGVADGPFAASLAARQSMTRAGEVPVVIAPGGTPGFVASHPVAALADPGPLGPDMVDVLGRLGLRRLGDLAALQVSDVLGRFGADGLLAHRLASGRDERPVDLAPPPPDLESSTELDPPAERVDQVAFAGKVLADGFEARLGARGLTCSRLLVVAETTGGASIERLWRHDGALDATAVAQRIRWQLDGWLQRPDAREHGGVWRITLRPDEVKPATGRQVGFWGGSSAADDRARRMAARIQGMVGQDGVLAPVRGGGRGPGEQIRLLPVDRVEPGAGPSAVDEPWPGRIPAPHPAVVHPRPLAAEVVDDGGGAVAVSGRGRPSARPDRLSIDGGPWRRVMGWSGPWLYDERWWDAVAHRRRARLQVVVEDGSAYLVALEDGRWWVEASYD